MTEVVYSRSRNPLSAGRLHQNPRIFAAIVPEATAVFIDGDWPDVEGAYVAAGVPVSHIDAAGNILNTAEPTRASTLAEVMPDFAAPKTDADRAHVEIPANWRDLPWSAAGEALSLRRLANRLSDEPVLKKADALAVIEAEARRRSLVGLVHMDAD